MRRDLTASATEASKAVDGRLKRIERVLEELGVRTWDPQGLPVDGGLAVVVVDRVEAEGATPTVRETLQPIVFIGDRLAAWGEVIASAPVQGPAYKDPGEATA